MDTTTPVCSDNARNTHLSARVQLKSQLLVEGDKLVPAVQPDLLHSRKLLKQAPDQLLSDTMSTPVAIHHDIIDHGPIDTIGAPSEDTRQAATDHPVPLWCGRRVSVYWPIAKTGDRRWTDRARRDYTT